MYYTVTKRNYNPAPENSSQDSLATAVSNLTVCGVLEEDEKDERKVWTP